MQRLSHSHQHQIPRAILPARPQRPARVEHLPHDLPRPQMPREPGLPRRAKDTSHRAPHLRAQAGGESALISHHHRLDRVPVAEPQQMLLRLPIRALCQRHRLERRRRAGPARQPAPQRRRIFFHPLHIAVHLAPQRPRMSRSQPVADDRALDLRKRQIVQRHAG